MSKNDQQILLIEDSVGRIYILSESSKLELFTSIPLYLFNKPRMLECLFSVEKMFVESLKCALMVTHIKSHEIHVTSNPQPLYLYTFIPKPGQARTKEVRSWQ
jgi:hypothetical protein